jgi:hypothetical protein
MKLKDLKQLILEAYVEVLREEGAILPSTTDKTLRNFPILVDVLKALFTNNFRDHVQEVTRIVPVPTEFNVTLVNGQNFFLKWMGKTPIKGRDNSSKEIKIKTVQEKEGWFQADIAGKKYNLNSEGQFKQALDSLGELFKYGPISNDDPSEEGETGDIFGGDSELEGGQSPFGGEMPEPAGKETEFEEEPQA